jgi:hypothetical protein
MCHTALMLLIFIPFRVLHSIVSYGRSKRGLKSAHYIVDGLFVEGQNFHSIVIVVPLHVSNFLRMLKRLKASSCVRVFNISADNQKIISASSELNLRSDGATQVVLTYVIERQLVRRSKHSLHGFQHVYRDNRTIV